MKKIFAVNLDLTDIDYGSYEYINEISGDKERKKERGFVEETSTMYNNVDPGNRSNTS